MQRPPGDLTRRIMLDAENARNFDQLFDEEDIEQTDSEATEDEADMYTGGPTMPRRCCKKLMLRDIVRKGDDHVDCLRHYIDQNQRRFLERIGENIMHLAASLQDCPKTLVCLCRRGGFSAEQEDARGNKPLELAAREGHAENMRALLPLMWRPDTRSLSTSSKEVRDVLREFNEQDDPWFSDFIDENFGDTSEEEDD
jgi:hypothetical protein